MTNGYLIDRRSQPHLLPAEIWEQAKHRLPLDGIVIIVFGPRSQTSGLMRTGWLPGLYDHVIDFSNQQFEFVARFFGGAPGLGCSLGDLGCVVVAKVGI
jgi:hypothetical protein